MTPEQIMNIITNTTIEVVPDLAGHSFSNNQSLEELGANSTDRADIIISVLSDLSLDIPLVETFGPTNIGELCQLLHEKLKGTS